MNLSPTMNYTTSLTVVNIKWWLHCVNLTLNEFTLQWFMINMKSKMLWTYNHVQNTRKPYLYIEYFKQVMKLIHLTFNLV